MCRKRVGEHNSPSELSNGSQDEGPLWEYDFQDTNLLLRWDLFLPGNVISKRTLCEVRQ